MTYRPCPENQPTLHHLHEEMKRAMAAIDDLTTAVTNLENEQTAVDTAVTDLQAEVAALQAAGTDTTAIEAIVARLAAVTARQTTDVAADPGAQPAAS